MESVEQSGGEDIRARFGRRVRYLRRVRKWTQEALAERAQVTAKYIGQVERAEVCPSLRVIEQLAAAFGVALSEMVSLNEQGSKSAESVHTQLTHHEIDRVREALELLRRLFD